MKIKLDANGITYPDHEIVRVCQIAIVCNQDLHFSSMGNLTVFRAELHQIKFDERPVVEWELYGKSVKFDNDVRSLDLNHTFDPTDHAFCRLIMPSPQHPILSLASMFRTVVCKQSSGVDLIAGQSYQLVSESERSGYIQIIDGSGEGYYYPKESFEE
jgi:hypothetical protein